MKVIKHHSLVASFATLPPPLQDQDVGLSVKMRYFCKHPGTMCVEAEAEDCHLSGYTQVYINGRTGDISILERTSIKSTHIINMVSQIIHVI